MGKETVKELTEHFRRPPAGYGVVPFYWWLGDKVTKEKLLYHLDSVADHHISGLQINYAHSDQGGCSFGLTYPGEPAVFSDEWWELVGWFIQEAKKRGIAVSLSDYTLGSPGQGYYADWILKRHPEMEGCQLERVQIRMKKGETAQYQRENLPVRAKVPSIGEKNMPVEEKDLPVGEQSVFAGGKRHPLPEGELVCAVYRQDGGKVLYLWPALPHPDTSREVFGQPELSLAEGFQAPEDGELLLVSACRKKLSIDPMYPGVGEQYIENFFDLFEKHFPGECGKGLNFFFSDELNFNIRGRLWNVFFADEFRKRKGYDIRPDLYLVFEEDCPEAVKIRLDYYDVIVQLEEENYFGPVFQWHEDRGMTYGCDHGGRGKDVTEFGDYMRTQKYNQGPGCDQPGLQSDIIKNKVASSIAHLYQRPRVWLEGFYGSGWGTSTARLTDAIARNFVMGHNLLSLHGFYYSTYGGFWEWAPPCNCVRMPYWKDMEKLTGAVERLSWLLSRGVHVCRIGIVYPAAAVEGGIGGEASVNTAFSLGERLYARGLDFDFLDFESIERAQIEKGRLAVSGEAYELIVIPDMKSVRGRMYEKLAEASEKGVTVMAVGGWPQYADAGIGAAGKVLERNGILVPDVECAEEEIEKRILPDVRPEQTESFYMLHRRTAGVELYMTYGIPEGELCFFRGKGTICLCDVWTGELKRLKPEKTEKDGVLVRMPVESTRFQVFMLGEVPAQEEWQGMPEKLRVIALPDRWKFTLLPTMDNTWGDFELPASRGTLPCQLKQIHRKDRLWKMGYGPAFLSKERFPDEETFRRELEMAADGVTEGYEEYAISLRYGVEGDPGHQGYHGLKGKVTSDFLRIGEPKETSRDVMFEPYRNGIGKIFATKVFSGQTQEVRILTGDIRPVRLYVNGQDVTGRDRVLLHAGENRVAAGYLECGRTHLVFARKDAEEHKEPLSMRWYHMKGLLPFSPYTAEQEEAEGPYRFMAPPSLEKLRFHVHGQVEKVTVDGKDAGLKQEGDEVTVSCTGLAEECAEVKIWLHPENGFAGGMVFDGIPEIVCGTGWIRAEDLSQIDALKYYSGGISYAAELMLEKKPEKRAWIEMEDLVSSAEVSVNGVLAGTCVAPPWRVQIDGLLQEGKNQIEIRVYNTLANHYEYLPTRYKGSLRSGLIGEVRLLEEE